MTGPTSFCPVCGVVWGVRPGTTMVCSHADEASRVVTVAQHPGQQKLDVPKVEKTRTHTRDDF